MKIDERFDKLADVYDVGIRKKVPQYDKLTEIFFSLIPFTKNANVDVLDLGVGTGTTAAMLLESYSKARLVGVDVASKMLRHAHQKLDAFGSRVTLLQQDFRALSPSGPFDLAYSILAVHHLPAADKTALFKTIWEKLKLTGVFILIDVVKGSDERLTELYVNSTVPTVPFDEVDKPSSLMEQLEWLQEAGFKTIDVPWKDYKLACIIAAKA